MIRPDNNGLRLLLTYLCILMIVGGLIYGYKPYPCDDFLRHVRHSEYKASSGGSGNGYAYMFPFSYFEEISFNPWYGFDMVAGYMNGYLGDENTILLCETIFISLFIIAVLLNLRTSRRSELFPFTVIGLFLLLSISFYRVSLIRPAIWVSILFFFGAMARGALSGIFLTALSASTYWLFWLYTIPLSVAHFFKGDRRFAISAAGTTVLSVIIWFLLTDGEYVRAITHLLAALASDRHGLRITENVFSLGKITDPIIFIFMGLAAMTFFRERKLDMHLLLIVLTLPVAAQARYFLDLTLPMLCIYVMNNNLSAIETFSERHKHILEAVCLSAMVLIIPPVKARSVANSQNYNLKSQNVFHMNSEKSFPGEGINLPEGSVLLTDGLPLNFQAIFDNPAPIRVIPSAEIGWNDKETVALIAGLQKDRAVKRSICQYLKSHHIQYFLSEYPVGADCLRHVRGFEQGRRVDLWQVL